MTGGGADGSRRAPIERITVVGQVHAGEAHLEGAHVDTVIVGGSPANRYLSAPPAKGDWFVGRDADLAALRDALVAAPDAVPVAVVGIGGIGKSALVRAYVEAFEAEYDLVAWFAAEQATSLHAQIIAVAQRLGGRPDSASEAIDLMRARLSSGPRWLLVFDNIDMSSQVHEYVPSTGGHVIVTARDPHVVVAGDRRVHLEPLRPVAARAWLAQAIEGPEPAITALAEALDGLPLAICQAIATCGAGHDDAESYLTEFRSVTSELRGRGRPADYRATLATTWTLSVRRLREEHPDALGVLFTLAFLAAEDLPWRWMAGEDDTVRSMLVSIERVGLLTWTGDVVRVHRLVQDDLRSRLTPVRAAEVIDTAAMALGPHVPRPDEPSAFAEWRTILPHLLRLLDHAVEVGAIEPRVLWAAILTAQHLQEAGQAGEAVVLMEACLGALDPSESVPQVQRGMATQTLAAAYRIGGDLARAETRGRSAVALWPSASALNDLGQTLQFKGDRPGAIEILERALAMARADQPVNGRLLAAVLHNLGQTLHQVGEHQRAAALLQEDLDLSIELLGPDHLQVAKSLRALAQIRMERGAPEQAKNMFEQALTITAQELGPEHPEYGLALMDAATAYSLIQDRQTAVDYRRRAVAILLETYGSHHYNVAIARANLAESLRVLGQADAALAEADEALAAYVRTYGSGSPENALGEAARANALAALGRFDEAIDASQRAVAGYIAVGQPTDVARARLNLASFRVQAGYATDADEIEGAARHLASIGLLRPEDEGRAQQLIERARLVRDP